MHNMLYKHTLEAVTYLYIYRILFVGYYDFIYQLLKIDMSEQ